MKKNYKVIIGLLPILLLSSCGSSPKLDNNEFVPSLDRKTDCTISVVGKYDNFEALEAEFDRFNLVYKNVKLSYSKLDDYENTIGTSLGKPNGGPNIYFTYTWMVGNSKYDLALSHAENLLDPSLKFNLDIIRPGLINRSGDGKVIMIPVFSRSYGVLVNENLFKKENVKVPTSWNDLLSVCNTFAQKGYQSPMMGYSKKASSSLMNTIAYPEFVATLAKNPEALAFANKLDPAAGEYTRGALEKVQQLVNSSAIDLTECDKIDNNYGKVVERFLKGDVPMMICAGDTASGTKKREGQSEEFLKSPFEYAFHPIPLNEQGGYFIDSPSIEFSVNKDCENLDMTNEFMRFLLTNKELSTMASAKRLITPTKEMSFDPIYAPFAQIPEERTFSPEVLGITDDLSTQIRIAAHKVGRGELTIDQAVEMYGSFKE